MNLPDDIRLEQVRQIQFYSHIKDRSSLEASYLQLEAHDNKFYVRHGTTGALEPVDNHLVRQFIEAVSGRQCEESSRLMFIEGGLAREFLAKIDLGDGGQIRLHSGSSHNPHMTPWKISEWKSDNSAEVDNILIGATIAPLLPPRFTNADLLADTEPVDADTGATQDLGTLMWRGVYFGPYEGKPPTNDLEAELFGALEKNDAETVDRLGGQIFENAGMDQELIRELGAAHDRIAGRLTARLSKAMGRSVQMDTFYHTIDIFYALIEAELAPFNLFTFNIGPAAGKAAIKFPQRLLEVLGRMEVAADGPFEFLAHSIAEEVEQTFGVPCRDLSPCPEPYEAVPPCQPVLTSVLSLEIDGDSEAISISYPTLDESGLLLLEKLIPRVVRDKFAAANLEEVQRSSPPSGKVSLPLGGEMEREGVQTGDGPLSRDEIDKLLRSVEGEREDGAEVEDMASHAQEEEREDGAEVEGMTSHAQSMLDMMGEKGEEAHERNADEERGRDKDDASGDEDDAISPDEIDHLFG